MRRRTVLQSFLGAVGLSPIARLASQDADQSLGPREIATLHALAEVVLPSAMGSDDRSRIVERFVRWIRNYRVDADRGHSYGSSTLSQRSGPSPALRYPAQFSALDASAVAEGASSFAALTSQKRRAVVEAALTGVNALPSRPTGANLVADFMGYYFNSGDAFDLAYGAAIGRDRCRSLEGSDAPPAPLMRR